VRKNRHSAFGIVTRKENGKTRFPGSILGRGER